MHLPTDFPELEVLREKMEAPFRRFVDQIDLKLRKGRVTVQADKYAIVDEIPTVQNRKVVLHLQDAWNYQNNYGSYPKYHVVNCKTLQEMRGRGQYERYHATRRTDGYFLVKLFDSDELSSYKLNICKNCLDKLKEQYGPDVFPTEPGKFPLADWFETFDYDEELEQTGSTHVPFDYSSETWQARSITCRQRADWKCEQCRIDLNDDRYFLHAHHKWGTRFNDPEDLMALCIHCHAEQPGHGHETLKDDPRYQEFMRKYGGALRSNTRFNLSNQQSQHTQGQSTSIIEEDIPF